MVMITYTLLALFATAGPQTRSSQDWCESGTVQVADAPWADLSSDAVIPIAEGRLPEALKKLRERKLVFISSKRATKLTGRKVATTPGEVFVLARAGVVGGPGVSIHQYLRNREGAVRFMGSVSQDRRKLLIVTGELTPRYPTRQFAVVVKTRPGIMTAAARCLWGG